MANLSRRTVLECNGNAALSLAALEAALPPPPPLDIEELLGDAVMQGMADMRYMSNGWTIRGS